MRKYSENEEWIIRSINSIEENKEFNKWHRDLIVKGLLPNGPYKLKDEHKLDRDAADNDFLDAIVQWKKETGWVNEKV